MFSAKIHAQQSTKPTNEKAKNKRRYDTGTCPALRRGDQPC
jgi:hypothetical protein